MSKLLLTIAFIFANQLYAEQPDWHELTHELSESIEDRQSLFNEFFNDEAPHYAMRNFPIRNSHFMAIAQGSHLLADRINQTEASWQDRHDHPHSQWTDLVLEGKPTGKWRYFVNANLVEPEITIDEAYITLPITANLQLKGGQFYSGFGRINSQHPHDRDFIDAPLIYQRLFGDSALLEKGIQVSLLPRPSWMIGVEQLTATNRDQFNHDRVQPSLSNLFTRWGNHWGSGLYSLVGASIAQGKVSANTQQQTQWKALDITVKQWISETDYWLVQGEMLSRHADIASDNQTGHYLMALYRWHPQWRAGIRNETAHSDGGNLPNSTRNSLLLEHDPNTWLRTRWQIGYETQPQGVEGFYAILGWQASLAWVE
jgi:hypothetical protein